MLAILFHFIGDYVTQSDWMAQNKTRAWAPAVSHALAYSLPFVLLTDSWSALVFIAGAHLIIDHWRLARYVCWLKNHLAPRSAWPKPWVYCMTTGYDPDAPPWLAVWLMIITDNVMHVCCNAIALRWL